MNPAILRLPIPSWAISGLIAASLLAAGCSRQPANPLPDVSQIERMTASLDFRPRQVVPKFEVPLKQWPSVLACFDQATFDSKPASWTVLGVLHITTKDGKQHTVALYNAQPGPFSIKVGDDKRYYHGMAMDETIAAIKVAYAAAQKASEVATDETSDDGDFALKWNGVSRLPIGATVKELNQIANDRSADRKRRADAIFTLFAYHLRPSSGRQVAATLKDVSWLGEVNLYGVYLLHGKVPVEWAETDTVFCLHLFPDESGRSDWVMYLRLGGKSGRSKEEALAFLKGEPDVRDNPKLVEYAICFPDGRIERYSELGLAVYHGSNVVDHARFGK